MIGASISNSFFGIAVDDTPFKDSKSMGALTSFTIFFYVLILKKSLTSTVSNTCQAMKSCDYNVIIPNT